MYNLYRECNVEYYRQSREMQMKNGRIWDEISAEAK